jgi:hypothetical protein
MPLSKKTSSIILGITSLICSRTMFALFNDLEGPNLLIVVVMAAIVYALSFLALRLFRPAVTGQKRLFLAIAIQILIVTVFYFCLR